MGGLYFETKPILNSDVPNLNYLITPPGAYHSHWFWLKSGLNPEMNDKEFWTNWQDKVYLTKSSPDYHGGACSLSVFYTVNGGNILLTEGQNSWEAVLFVVETQWGLKKDVDPKLYDRAWDYVDQYFKDNPLTDPDNLTKHFEVPVPAKPDWVP